MTPVLEVLEVDAPVVSKKGKAIAKSPSTKSEKDDTKPIVSDIMPQKLDFRTDCIVRGKTEKQTSDWNRPVDEYVYVIRSKHQLIIQEECKWKHDTHIYPAREDEHITSYRARHIFTYTYPFIPEFEPSINSVIEAMRKKYKTCLAQVGPQVWRVFACLQYLASEVKENFTLHHLLYLYSPRLYGRGVFTLFAWGNRAIISSTDDDYVRGDGYKRFVIVPIRS